MLKRYKKLLFSVLIGFFGLLLIVLSNYKSTENANLTSNTTENALENKIERFLLNIEGIKKVDVVLTLKNDIEVSYNENQGNNNVNGIAIACTNGNDPEIQEKITRIISAFLDLPANRIEIVGLG